jgi:hypothetical protein
MYCSAQASFYSKPSQLGHVTQVEIKKGKPQMNE